MKNLTDKEKERLKNWEIYLARQVFKEIIQNKIKEKVKKGLKK